MAAIATRVVPLSVVVLLITTAAAAGASVEARIGSGTWHGAKWEFRGGAWRDGSYCTAMLLRDKEDSRSCGDVSKQDGIGYGARSGKPGPDYVMGAVETKARSVRIEFFDRAAIAVRTIAAPPSVQGGVRFFVKLLPCPATPRKLVARDASGAIVARLVVTRHMEAHC